MGKLSKNDKYFQKTFVEDLVNLIRLTKSNNEESKIKYELFIKNENLTPYQKKYFKKLMFDDIPYSETKQKMEKLFEKDINCVSFSGKELKNIQRFFREKKLKNLK